METTPRHVSRACWLRQHGACWSKAGGVCECNCCHPAPIPTNVGQISDMKSSEISPKLGETTDTTDTERG